jgi:hypothetical protein
MSILFRIRRTNILSHTTAQLIPSANLGTSLRRHGSIFLGPASVMGRNSGSSLAKDPASEHHISSYSPLQPRQTPAPSDILGFRAKEVARE